MDKLLASARPFLFGLFTGLLSVGVIWIVAKRPEGKPVELIPPPPTPTTAPLRIHVTGAVAAPGVYELAPGSIVQDAIRAAGGATADGDPGRLNLAAPLEDGQQIVVPGLAPTSIAAPSRGAPSLTPNPSSPSPANKVNINTASAEELESLPEIGPVTAAKIVEHRTLNGPFQTIEEITNVKGIGPATYNAIKDLITVGP